MRTGIHLNANFTGAKFDSGNCEVEVLNAQATYDPVAVDFKAPCSTPNCDNSIANIEAYIRSREVDVPVRALLEDEVALKSLARDVDFNFICLNSEEATLGNLLDRDGHFVNRYDCLIDDAERRVNLDSEGRGGRETWNVQGDVT